MHSQILKLPKMINIFGSPIFGGGHLSMLTIKPRPTRQQSASCVWSCNEKTRGKAMLFELVSKTSKNAVFFIGADDGNRTRDSVANNTSLQLLPLPKVLSFVSFLLIPKMINIFGTPIFGGGHFSFIK